VLACLVVAALYHAYLHNLPSLIPSNIFCDRRHINIEQSLEQKKAAMMAMLQCFVTVRYQT
ncbi:hypothetical protein, partial [Oleiphilus sp. HI0079]|uniref:hypothetical protein n=1 Tax=Oleiphilus sp. HI0079 TaxID=1822254 RepID=UPI001E5932B6